MSSTLSDYEYDLPRELIAQRAPERRESSRMMVLRREERTIEHRRFVELKMFLRPGDLLVLNDTRVLAAKRVSSDQGDNVRYQTVFARAPGALAAPTAGLHFTQQIVRKLPHAFITLHVGIGTFLPVRSENLAEHRMHSEHFSISAEAANKINDAERIIAIGTTTVRVLESARSKNGRLLAQEGSTDLFIYPPYRFQAVDLLLTNFHLPRSTLLMLVSAFAGREFLLRAYREAIGEGYRFYSYGDCMLIL